MQNKKCKVKKSNDYKDFVCDQTRMEKKVVGVV